MVGPSSHGGESFDLESLAVDAPAEATELRLRLGRRIDEYWDRHRDPREGHHDRDALTADERERLRALDYAK